MRPRLRQVHVARGQGRDLGFRREHARVSRHHVHGPGWAQGVDVQGLDPGVGLVSPVHDEGELSRVRGEDHLVRRPIPPLPRGDRARAQRGVPVRLVRDVLPDVQAERRGLAVASVVVDQDALTRDGRRGGGVRRGVTRDDGRGARGGGGVLVRDARAATGDPVRRVRDVEDLA